MNKKVPDNEARTTALEKRTTALEAAENLTGSLDDNTDALNRVRKRYRLTMVLIASVAITMLAAARINYDGHVRRCETSNQLREEVEFKFIAIAGSLERIGVGDTPNEAELIEILYEKFPRIDCSEIDWLGR